LGTSLEPPKMAIPLAQCTSYRSIREKVEPDCYTLTRPNVLVKTELVLFLH